MKQSNIKKFIGNTSWILFQNIYSMLVSLVVGSLSARFLGPSNYGMLSYGSSIISFFLIVSKLGMGSVVVPEMVRTPEKEGSYMGAAVFLRLIASILSLLMVGVIIIILEPDNHLLWIVTILQAIAIVFQSTEVFYYWFQAKMQMKYVTITTMVALTVTSVWRIMLLVFHSSVEWFALSATISAFICGIMIIFFYLRNTTCKLSFNKKDTFFILKNSYQYMLYSMTATLYMQLDKIMVGKILDEEAVAFYSAAGAIAVMWEFIPNALVDSARPLLVEEYDKNYESFEKKYQILMLAVTMLGVLVGIFFLVFSKLGIWILYGKEYYAANSALKILIWGSVFSVIGTLRSIWIVLVRKGEYMKYFTFIGAGLNAFMNIIFIPRWGITGAAVTTLITKFIVGVLAPIFFKETRPFLSLYFGSILRMNELFKEVKKRILK